MYETLHWSIVVLYACEHSGSYWFLLKSTYSLLILVHQFLLKDEFVNLMLFKKFSKIGPITTTNFIGNNSLYNFTFKLPLWFVVNKKQINTCNKQLSEKKVVPVLHSLHLLVCNSPFWDCDIQARSHRQSTSTQAKDFYILTYFTTIFICLISKCVLVKTQLSFLI